ncbi:hypothetical protein DAI22_08g086050 [Oryza sativa Japonica Group]|nr:hypothetical protein DAI22_08g086050 [Oryza sativa Japonica Group]
MSYDDSSSPPRLLGRRILHRLPSSPPQALDPPPIPLLASAGAGSAAGQSRGGDVMILKSIRYFCDCSIWVVFSDGPQMGRLRVCVDVLCWFGGGIGHMCVCCHLYGELSCKAIIE